VKRPLFVPVAAPLAWLIFSACAETPSNPPYLGPCESDGASCGAGVVGGGAGTPEDSGASSSSCPINAADAQCAQCAEASCCASLDACTASTDCQNLLRCEQSCAGAAACASDCEGQAPNGVALLNELTSCLDVKCPVCSESGIGDPCVAQGNACNPGLSCGGLWCTKACVRSTDCAGLGAGGGNELGFPNACVATASAGGQCRPGCQTDSDCALFQGSFCLATTSSEGVSVQTCASPLDAGAD
jgi:hypothetical protein